MENLICSNSPVVFSYESLDVRVIERDGVPWFVAADVCSILGIQNSTDAIRRLDEDERTLVSIEGASNGLPVNAVNESGLYTLVLSSRKPEAKWFKRWITHDVLPAIRKNGCYTAAPVPVVDTSNVMQILEQMFEVTKTHDRKLTTLCSRVEQLETDTRLEFWQAAKLQAEMARKLAVWRKNDTSRQAHATSYHSVAWAPIKRKYGVWRYTEIPKLKFEEALGLIQSLPDVFDFNTVRRLGGAQ